MKKTAILFLCVLELCMLPCDPESFAADRDPTQVLEVRVENLTREKLIRLIEMGVDVDAVWQDSGRIYVWPEQVQAIIELGYDLRIERIDPKARQVRTEGYHSITSLTQELIDLAAAYPSICRLYSIGKSEEGRDLWVMKISDNVDTQEDEPEFSYISSMHGNEPVGMELCMNLIHLLLEKYGELSGITRVVNEIEIWIMPLMNPDGYVLQTRYNVNGYDLNRSFPDRVSDPVNSPAGRPVEVQHVMNWAGSLAPVLSANIHGGALVANYPYDSDPNRYAAYSAAPDDALFIQQALTYSKLNGPMWNSPYFSQGITNGVQWYQLDGGIQDWHYIWRGCNHITLEISDDKWPPYSDIPQLWEDNREAMLAYMEWCLKGVRGIVTDSRRGPIAATVQAVGIAHDVYTDPDTGDYHRMLLPGVYDLMFWTKGFATHMVKGVEVGSGDAVRVDVTLSPVALGDLNADGEIGLGDGILGLKAVCGEKDLPLIHQGAGLRADGKIGLEDVVNILRRTTEK